MFFILRYLNGVVGQFLTDGQAGDGHDAGGNTLTLEAFLPHLGYNQRFGFFNFYPHLFSQYDTLL